MFLDIKVKERIYKSKKSSENDGFLESSTMKQFDKNPSTVKGRKEERRKREKIMYNTVYFNS